MNLDGLTPERQRDAILLLALSRSMDSEAESLERGVDLSGRQDDTLTTARNEAEPPTVKNR